MSLLPHRHQHIAIVAALASLTACQKSEYEIVMEQIDNQMSWLHEADPSEDVRAAILHKDYRLRAVYGYSIYVPTTDLTCVDLETQVNPIQGTTDAVVGNEHAKLIALAVTYAEEYNSLLRSYLEEQGLWKCRASD